MKYFIDTSAFIALLDRGDRLHKKALACSLLLKEEPPPLVTSNFALDETYTWLLYHVGHPAAVSFGDEVQNDPGLKIVTVDEIIEKEAWLIFKKYRDQKFSYTDCTSFALMKLLGLKVAFAFDEHFRVMGLGMVPLS